MPVEWSQFQPKTTQFLKPNEKLLNCFCNTSWRFNVTMVHIGLYFVASRFINTAWNDSCLWRMDLDKSLSYMDGRMQWCSYCMCKCRFTQWAWCSNHRTRKYPEHTFRCGLAYTLHQQDYSLSRTLDLVQRRRSVNYLYLQHKYSTAEYFI